MKISLVKYFFTSLVSRNALLKITNIFSSFLLSKILSAKKKGLTLKKCVQFIQNAYNYKRKNLPASRRSVTVSVTECALTFNEP